MRKAYSLQEYAFYIYLTSPQQYVVFITTFLYAYIFLVFLINKRKENK